MIVAMTDAELTEAITLVESAGPEHAALLQKLRKMQGYVVCSTITKRQAAAWDALKKR
jgi:hypothetical protein